MRSLHLVRTLSKERFMCNSVPSSDLGNAPRCQLTFTGKEQIITRAPSRWILPAEHGHSNSPAIGVSRGGEVPPLNRWRRGFGQVSRQREPEIMK